jgi:hypothetical protein
VLNVYILVLACLLVRPICAQTSWTIHPDAPGNLTSSAKLKYTNNSFRLVWEPISYFSPTVVYMTDLNVVPDIPTPFTFSVTSQAMGVDPAPGSIKKLTIRYVTALGEYQAVVQDGSSLSIPSVSHTLVGPAKQVSGFNVLSATYGTTTKVADVRNVFRTKNLTFSNSYTSFDLKDFIYDGTGALLLLGGDYRPAVAYPNSSGAYQVQSISISNSFYDPYFYGMSVCSAYGNGNLVMGFSGTSYSPYSSSQSLIAASSPGNTGYYKYTWTAPALAPGFVVKNIIYEGGKFMAVGARHNSVFPYSSKGAVLVSTDGVEWTTVVISGTTSLNAVSRNNDQWVVVGDAGSVLTSTNGFEWNRITVPGAGNLVSVACGNGNVAVGSSTGRIYTSTDLSSWRLQNVATGTVSSLAVGNNRFMALVGTKVYQSSFSAVGIADIVSQPLSSFTIPQQSVLLSVGAAGSAPLAYQWYSGFSGDTSQPIEGATGSSYQTPPLTDTRSYWVRVTNGIGNEDSNTATLTMQAPPVITVQPLTKTLSMGSSVSTSITVTGNNIAYQWYNGFSGDVSTPLQGKTSASLTVPSQQPGVSYYWVRVSNALGTLDSTNIRAEVTPVWPAIVDEPLDLVTTRGDYESIRVRANGPSLTYQWYGGISGDTSRPLPSASSSFDPPYNIPGSYQYWVRVSNSLGYVDSRTISFSVLNTQIPIITRQPYDTTTYTGSSKSISVSASGNDLSYAWYGGESGDTSVLLTASGSSFSPSHSTTGVYRYWVRVSNPSGSVDSVAVTYIVKPQGVGLITRHPVDTSTVVNSSISVSVTASGSGLSYQWYSGVSGDTSAVQGGKTASSFSPPVATVGQNSYWVRVTSGAIVEDSETAIVKIISPILVITEQPLDRTAYVGDSFSYYVQTSGSNVTYQWYSGMSGDTSNPLANKTSYSFSPSVSLAGTFFYWMRASSGLEHVNSQTAKVTVIGQKPFFTTQPQDQLVQQGSGNVSLTSALDNSSGASLQWYQGISGDISVPLSGKTSSSLSISSPLAGTYSYWVRATNPYGIENSRTAVLSVTSALYSHWLVQNGLPSDGSGLGAPGASPNHDGVANLLKYALGMDVTDGFNASRGPQIGTLQIGTSNYLTLKFIHSKSAQSVQLFVEESTSLDTWTMSAIECGPSYDNGDGTMTRTFRASRSMSAERGGYLRLKVTSN